jgi:hypothetical protein
LVDAWKNALSLAPPGMLGRANMAVEYITNHLRFSAQALDWATLIENRICKPW